LKQPSYKAANAYAKQRRRVLINVSQITESPLVAFKCRRPSTAPACQGFTLSAEVVSPLCASSVCEFADAGKNRFHGWPRSRLME